MKEFALRLFLGAMVIAMFSPAILAREIASYGLVLPRIGASTTGWLTKTNASGAVNNNESTGGGKNLNTAIRNAYSNTDITPTYNLSSGSRIIMDYNGGGRHYIYSNTTLALASQFGNLVKIQTQGTWSPDQW